MVSLAVFAVEGVHKLSHHPVLSTQFLLVNVINIPHSGLNRPKMGRLLKCTEKVLLRLKFNEEHDAVGPGIVISNLGAKKCQKRAKIGEKTFKLLKRFLLLFPFGRGVNRPAAAG